MPVSSTYAFPPSLVPASGQIPLADSSAIQQATDALFVNTAVGKYLTALGGNYGIPRPRLAPADDEMYRRIVQAIAFLPKTVLSTLYYLMEAVFGSQASYVAQDLRPWRIYEVNPNEIIIEIPFDILGASNANASYSHGWNGVVLSGASTTVFSCSGDARVAATNLVGLGASVVVSGAYEEKTISSVSYNSGTDQTQITVGSVYSGTPAAGALFFITVPESSSFRGDYVAPIWYAKGTGTGGVNTFTDGTASMVVNVHVGRFLRLKGGAIHYPINANTATVFTLGANGATPADGSYAVVQSPLDASEESDTPTTPVHDDRVYITGDGLYEVVKQYLLEIVRASGVVVRLEKL